MKNIIFSLLLVGLSFYLSSCDDDGLGDGQWESITTQDPGDKAGVGTVNGGLYNGDMEINNAVESNLPDGWEDLVSGFRAPNNYEFFHSEDNALGTRSAQIFGFNIDNENEYGFLSQRIEAPDVPDNSLIRIRGKVRTENLQGNGFEISAFAYNNEGVFMFGVSTIQETFRVRGTTEWTEYTSDVAAFPIGVAQIQIVLGIGQNTTGNVYFDDISLEVD